MQNLLWGLETPKPEPGYPKPGFTTSNPNPGFTCGRPGFSMMHNLLAIIDKKNVIKLPKFKKMVNWHCTVLIPFIGASIISPPHIPVVIFSLNRNW